MIYIEESRLAFLVSDHANDVNLARTRRRSNMNVLTAGTVPRTRMRRNDMLTHYTSLGPRGLAPCLALSIESSTTQSPNGARPTLVGSVVSTSTGQPQRSTLGTPQTTTGRSVLPTSGSNTNFVNATFQKISIVLIIFASTSSTRMQLYWGIGRRSWRKFACRSQRTTSCPVVERLESSELFTIGLAYEVLCRQGKVSLTQVRTVNWGRASGPKQNSTE